MEVDLNAGVNTVAQQRLNNQKFLANQNQLTSDFLTKFGNTIAGQGTTSDAAARIGEEVGLPALRQNAFNLQNQLIDIPEVYKTANRGFDTNANQLARIVNQKTAELGPLADRATARAQFAENTVNTRLGYLQNDWNRQLLPLTTEKDFLTDRMARETSMYTQENQMELDAILDKVRNGITLSEGEKNRAQQLAIAEKGYENALKIAQENNKAKAENPFVTVGEGSSIFNTSTGKSVYTAPKSYAPNTYPTAVTPTLKTTPSPSISQTLGSPFNWSQFGL